MEANPLTKLELLQLAYKQYTKDLEQMATYLDMTRELEDETDEIGTLSTFLTALAFVHPDLKKTGLSYFLDVIDDIDIIYIRSKCYPESTMNHLQKTYIPILLTCYARVSDLSGRIFGNEISHQFIKIGLDIADRFNFDSRKYHRARMLCEVQHAKVLYEQKQYSRSYTIVTEIPLDEYSTDNRDIFALKSLLLGKLFAASDFETIAEIYSDLECQKLATKHLLQAYKLHNLIIYWNEEAIGLFTILYGIAKRTKDFINAHKFMLKIRKYSKIVKSQQNNQLAVAEIQRLEQEFARLNINNSK